MREKLQLILLGLSLMLLAFAFNASAAPPAAPDLNTTLNCNNYHDTYQDSFVRVNCRFSYRNGSTYPVNGNTLGCSYDVHNGAGNRTLLSGQYTEGGDPMQLDYYGYYSYSFKVDDRFLLFNNYSIDTYCANEESELNFTVYPNPTNPTTDRVYNWINSGLNNPQSSFLGIVIALTAIGALATITGWFIQRAKRGY